MRGRYRRFCASVPASRIGYPPSADAPQFVAVAAHAQAISSATSATASAPMSLPPYASGIQVPIRPCCARSRIGSSG